VLLAQGIPEPIAHGSIRLSLSRYPTDAEIDEAVAGGLFELRHEERYRVVHAFGSGSECLDEVSAWAGTAVPDDVAARLAQGAGTATVEHDVRLRLFDAS
jgi:hypothetical protein